MKKKWLPKILGGISILALFTAAIGFYIQSKEKRNESEPLVIPEIVFPQYAGSSLAGISYENYIKENDIKNYDSVHQVIVVTDDQIKKTKQKAKKAFAMDSATEQSLRDVEVYKTQESTLQLYKNGSYMYRINQRDMHECLLSDEQAIEKATSFLENQGLLPEEFSYSKIGYDKQTNLQNPENEIIVGKQVYFERVIDGLEVKGNSMIYVSIDGSGEIAEVYCAYRDIEQYESVNEVIGLDEAIQSLENQKGLICVDENADKVILENAEIIYWEDADAFSTNNTIQPVYKITGKAYQGSELLGEFQAIESAVK